MENQENPAVDSATSYEPATKRRKLIIKVREYGGGYRSYTLGECKHSIVRQEKCSACGQQMKADHGRAFSYIEKGLRLTDDGIESLSRDRSKKTFREKKFHLVLDLDHTLLHSRKIQDLNSEEEYLLRPDRMGCMEDLSRPSALRSEWLVKLRPFARDFLKEASTMFEMYIYTKGSADYAMAIANLLDPEKRYFGPRVISRSESPNEKSLDLVLGEQCGIIILDDTKEVWPNHQDNLILMESYDFFAPKRGRHCKSYSEKKTDESVTDGALANVLRVLKRIHMLFFNQKLLAYRDVRLMIRIMRAIILRGCTIYFSDDFVLMDLQLENARYGHMAEELGAVLTNDRLDSSITHVVSIEIGMEDFQWAVQEKKFLVNPRWLEAAYYYWQKPPEKNYPIDHKPNLRH